MEAVTGPTVRPLTAADTGMVREWIVRHWGAEIVVARAAAIRPAGLPGFTAELDGRVVGLLTYRVMGDACEVVSIDSDLEGRGIGTRLLEAAADAARGAGCRRLWLITTNDNLPALRFYQRRGMRLAAVHRGAVDEARRIKPEIPLSGYAGIPLHDELELEQWLDESQAAPREIVP